jgi:hypothetical protein
MTLNKAMMALTLSLVAGGAMAGGSTTVDFSSGNEGWYGLQPADGNGGSGVDTSIGNGGALRTVIENFGIEFGTTTNAAFLGDYTAKGPVTLGLDIKASEIKYFGQDVSRNVVVELRDYGNTPAGMPYSSVWYNLGTIDATQDWQHLSVTIGDPASTALPAGWGGYGSSDDAGGPKLPDGRSFADILSSVDEVVFGTYVPGYMYGFTNFDVAVDNISISAVPEPSTYAMLLGGLGLIGWASRRKASGKESGNPGMRAA